MLLLDLALSKSHRLGKEGAEQGPSYGGGAAATFGGSGSACKKGAAATESRVETPQPSAIAARLQWGGGGARGGLLWVPPVRGC